MLTQDQYRFELYKHLEDDNFFKQILKCLISEKVFDFEIIRRKQHETYTFMHEFNSMYLFVTQCRQKTCHVAKCLSWFI